MAVHSFREEVRTIALRRDEAKRHAILHAAVQVMAESGYHNAQISRIARAAGVADGTVYLYFKNKEDILVSVLREAISSIVSEAQSMMATCTHADEALARIVRQYFQTLGDNPRLAMVTQVHLRQVDVEMRRKIGDMIRPFNKLLDEIVQMGVEEGIYRQGINPRIARRMIFGTMDETVTAWVLSEGRYPLASLAEDAVDVLLHGLRRYDVDRR